MVVDDITTRLDTVALLLPLRVSLLEMADRDNLLGPDNWGAVVPTISRALGSTNEILVQPFAVAWGMLNAALRRLDHVQDEDVHLEPLPTVPVAGARYNLLLSYYLLATTLLDNLDSTAIPAARLLRLRRWWADCLLRVASGQQADLELFQHDCTSVGALDEYQHIVQAKTGALYALAFGGTAILLTDDIRTITILSEVGEVYGMLVQYGDDVHDINEQANATLTLPRVHAALLRQHNHLPAHNTQTFWRYIYKTYVQQVEHALALLDSSTSITVRQLFATTFEAGYGGTTAP